MYQSTICAKSICSNPSNRESGKYWEKQSSQRQQRKWQQWQTSTTTAKADFSRRPPPSSTASLPTARRPLQIHQLPRQRLQHSSVMKRQMSTTSKEVDFAETSGDAAATEETAAAVVPAPTANPTLRQLHLNSLKAFPGSNNSFPRGHVGFIASLGKKPTSVRVTAPNSNPSHLSNKKCRETLREVDACELGDLHIKHKQ